MPGGAAVRDERSEVEIVHPRCLTGRQPPCSLDPAERSRTRSIGSTTYPAPAPMTGKRSTITDVARHAGVSKATVSAVLNESAPVKDATRDRVLAAIELLNYRPGGAHAARGGRGVGARRDRSVGLL